MSWSPKLAVIIYFQLPVKPDVKILAKSLAVLFFKTSLIPLRFR